MTEPRQSEQSLQTLQTLLDHAARERDETLAVLMQAEDQTRRLREQLQQLQAYHADYSARAPGQGGHAVAIDQLRSHHAFMQRLDQALGQQQGLLEGADAHAALQRQVLLERETRVASVRKLIERRTQEQQRSAARREQQRSDEAAARRQWRDSAQSRPPMSH